MPLPKDTRLWESKMNIFSDIVNSLPGAVAQGLIWGIMAVGVFITYKILDIADLTVDGSICTGDVYKRQRLYSAFCTPLFPFGCAITEK